MWESCGGRQVDGERVWEGDYQEQADAAGTRLVDQGPESVAHQRRRTIGGSTRAGLDQRPEKLATRGKKS